MPATAPQTLADRYTAAFPGSKQRFEKAKGIFPCGVTHDTRMMDPFPVYVTHAKGAYKWDVDGHELIDYFVGHGSHLLGHSPRRRGDGGAGADGEGHALRRVPRPRNRVGPARPEARAQSPSACGSPAAAPRRR